MDASSRPRVKNKAAAPVQITAEQLLREAVSHQEEKPKAPLQRFADEEELHEYQGSYTLSVSSRPLLRDLGRKRKEFEDYIRRNKTNVNNFTRYGFLCPWFDFLLGYGSNFNRYASWELEQREFARARSIYERALDSGHSTETRVWLR